MPSVDLPPDPTAAIARPGHAAARMLPWPLPAVLAWSMGWLVALALRQAGFAAPWDLLSGATAGAALAMRIAGHWRRLLAAAGFPVSAALVAGADGGGWGATAWLAAMVPLLLFYPLRAWRDAPFFPTPAVALQGLPGAVHPAPSRVLDAGCGLGHGLAALQRLWPGAQLHGDEWSAPMAWLTAWRLPAAQVRRGDMWTRHWGGFDLVYLFQRPETMARAWEKACAEMDPGAWLVSLEFPVPGVASQARLDEGVGRPLYLYRLPTQGIGGRSARRRSRRRGPAAGAGSIAGSVGR